MWWCRTATSTTPCRCARTPTLRRQRHAPGHQVRLQASAVARPDPVRLRQAGNDHPIGDFNRYIATEEELPQRHYDPDKARFHLKQAGMENLKVQLYSSDVAFEGAVDAASLYKENAKDCGIDIEIVRHPADGYWSNVWMNQAWCMSYWSGRPTEDWQFTEGYLSTANYNDTFWRNERFERCCGRSGHPG